MFRSTDPLPCPPPYPSESHRQVGVQDGLAMLENVQKEGRRKGHRGEQYSFKPSSNVIPRRKYQVCYLAPSKRMQTSDLLEAPLLIQTPDSRDAIV